MNKTELTKENIYLPLDGMSEAELTEVFNLLVELGEPICHSLQIFLYYSNSSILIKHYNCWKSFKSSVLTSRTKVTLEQFKQILKPDTMNKEFTPIAMRCTQEQFETIKTNLVNVKIQNISEFNECCYLVNNLGGELMLISNVTYYAKSDYGRKIHKQWNEEIFLKACGIETETLQQKQERLTAELAEVNKQIEENKINVGDWVFSELNNFFFKYEFGRLKGDLQKITDQELINKLNTYL